MTLVKFSLLLCLCLLAGSCPSRRSRYHPMAAVAACAPPPLPTTTSEPVLMPVPSASAAAAPVWRCAA
jgi:hypothetical protein